jgi:hypothetical protein
MSLILATFVTCIFGNLIVSSQKVGANPCGRPVGQAQGRAPTPSN